MVVNSVVAHSFPIGLLTVSTLAHNPKVQIIFITEFDGKTLVGIPKSAWHKKTAQRVLVAGWLIKATAIETSACLVEDRENVIPDVTMQLWVGFLKADVIPHVDFSQTEFDAEYTFQVEGTEFCLPHAQALADAANEHFSFFSATDGLPDVEGEEKPYEEPGSADISSRINRLEGFMEDISQNIRLLMEERGQTFAPPRTYGPASSFAKPARGAVPSPGRKAALKKTVQPKAPGSSETFPHLAPDVVQAALQAGIGEDVLSQMSKLVASNPKGAKLGDLNPKVLPCPPLLASILCKML